MNRTFVYRTLRNRQVAIWVTYLLSAALVAAWILVFLLGISHNGWVDWASPLGFIPMLMAVLMHALTAVMLKLNRSVTRSIQVLAVFTPFCVWYNLMGWYRMFDAMVVIMTTIVLLIIGDVRVFARNTKH